MSWSVFWAVVFYAAAGGSALVSLMIAVKGVAEIRELLGMLGRHRGKD